jgi:predicted dehydrogenase
MADEKKGAEAPGGGEPVAPQPEPVRRGRTIDRRDLLLGLSTVPALGLFGYAWSRQRGYEQVQRERAQAGKPPAPKDLREVNVALLGVGAQGQVLLDSMLRIPGLRFRAVCDIWTEYNQKRAVNTLRKFKYDVKGYEDYREMLDKEKDVDAVVIATPDFWHSPHTVDCLEAGKHVYCEKEMSNTLEGARAMVLAARETGRLLQIGHQRRSHPRYRFAYEKLLGEAKILGRIVTVNGQWNRSVAPDLGWPERYAIPDVRLKQYGFEDMHQFRNWRWYKGKGGGPIVDLGSHQIDIYNWFLGANPSYVMASGGLDYHDPATHEWYDTVMAVYEYETKAGTARAYYQTQTTNGSQGYFENFMGDQGTLVISESEANYPGFLYRDPNAPAWDQWVQRGYVSAPKIQEQKKEEEGAVLDVRESVSPDLHRVPVVLRDPYHQPHLQNFFDAVRGTATLHCPAEDGYRTAVTVLKVNEAVEARQRLPFTPEDFRV